MTVLIFIFMNLIACVSSYFLVYRILRNYFFRDALICWFICYLAQIIFSELILGFLGILYLKNIIFLNLLILLFAWLMSRGRKSSFNLEGARNAVVEIFSDRMLLFGFSLILGFGLIKIFINLINPPFGWDSLNYHFTFPVEWLKNGNLNNPIVINDDPFPTYYPINGSLFFLWLIFPFKSAFLADIGQLPFFLISFFAVFSICRKLKFDYVYSFLCASSFVIIPNFFKQLQIGYVDIMVAGVFLIILNSLFLLKEEFNLKNVFLFCLSFAIFIGFKTTAIAYSIFAFLPFVYFIFSQQQKKIRHKAGYMILFLSLVSLFGCLSYFRNFILTGNPLYPLNVTLANNPIFKGPIDKITFTARNVKCDYSLAKLLFHEGLGLQTLLVVLPGAIFGPVINIFRNKNRDLFLNYFMFLPLLLYSAYRFILPIPNSRYLYPALSAGIIVGFYVLRSLKIPAKIIILTATIYIISSVFESARHLELVLSIGMSLLLFGCLAFYFKYRRQKNIVLRKNIIIGGIIIFIIILNLLYRDYKNNEYVRYLKRSRYGQELTSAWLWLNENTRGNNIAYVGRPLPYPLYGTDFKNNVYYVSLNSLDPTYLHDFKNSNYRWDKYAENMHRSFHRDNNYRGNAEYAIWLRNTKNRKTGLLFIYSLHHTQEIMFPIEDEWARGHPEDFALAFNNQMVRIYKVE